MKRMKIDINAILLEKGCLSRQSERNSGRAHWRGLLEGSSSCRAPLPMPLEISVVHLHLEILEINGNKHSCSFISCLVYLIPIFVSLLEVRRSIFE